jgi:hypothetical protein
MVNNPRLVRSTFVNFVVKGKGSDPQMNSMFTAKSAKGAKGKPNLF